MRLLLAAVVILAYLGCFFAKCEAKENPQMIELQCAGEMFHASTITISDLGVRVKGSSATTLWLAKDPKNGVVMNHESGVFLIQPAEDWVHYYQRNHPHPTLETIRSSPFQITPDRSAIKTLVYRGDPEQEVGEIVSLKDTKVAPLVMAFWCNLLMSKPELGFPIALKVLSTGHHWERRFMKNASKSERGKSTWITLVEFKSMRSIPLDRNIFTIPKTYKQAHDMGGLFFSQDGVMKSTDLDDMFRTPLK